MTTATKSSPPTGGATPAADLAPSPPTSQGRRTRGLGRSHGSSVWRTGVQAATPDGVKSYITKTDDPEEPHVRLMKDELPSVALGWSRE